MANFSQIFKFFRKYWPAIAIILIIIIGFYVRNLDYKWPYLRNIDSYNYYRYIDDIVVNNGTLPVHDNLMLAPYGVDRVGGNNFYLYLAAFSYMFYSFFFPAVQLWQFLVWFPALLASLVAIPMYYIGKYLYDRRAGVIMAFLMVFDISNVSRSLAGDPDTDAIVLLMPIIFMALFLFTYKYVSKRDNFNKKSIIYSLIAGVALFLWSFTWGGFWYIVWLITGLIIIKLIVNYLQKRNLNEFWKISKNIVFSFVAIIAVFLALAVFVMGPSIINTTLEGPFTFSQIKTEEGINFPNVYVSVAELQAPGSAEEVISRITTVNFRENPLILFISPLFLLIYCLIYLSYSYFKKREHFDTLIILLIWFIGPFLATLVATRFTILFSAPIAIGSGIILSKAWKMASGEDKNFYD